MPPPHWGLGPRGPGREKAWAQRQVRLSVCLVFECPSAGQNEPRGRQVSDWGLTPLFLIGKRVVRCIGATEPVLYRVSGWRGASPSLGL